jgi:hypothetical protein
MRRSLAAALTLLALPLTAAPGQQQPQPRFETVARTGEQETTGGGTALSALRARAVDSAARYAAQQAASASVRWSDVANGRAP